MSHARLGLIGIVKDAAKDDWWGTMRRVAEIGYEGVEGVDPLLKGDVKENLARFRDLGLEALTLSASRERLRDELDAVLADAKALGVERVSCWWAPMSSREEVLADAELFNAAGRRLQEEGMILAYHHHDHEFVRVFDGVTAFDLLAAYTDPSAVRFVVDIAWALVGGQDPAALIRRLGPRTASLHVKDVAVPARDDDRKVPFTAVGTGVVDIEAAVRAGLSVGATWAVVEQDTLRNLDAWETITLSRLYLLERGLIARRPTAS